MNGEHDPDENPSLDEIESVAPSAVSFWLTEADALIDAHYGSDYAAKHPAVVAGFVNACAMVYQAERVNDAARKISRALLGIADSLEGLSQPMQNERLAGIETELFRLANKAGEAIETLSGRSNGSK